MAQPAAERDPRANELARAQALCQRLISDMVESGDYTCSDAEWARACSDELDTVRATCRSWAETALEDGWTVPLETLSIAGLDGSAAPSEQRPREDLGR